MRKKILTWYRTIPTEKIGETNSGKSMTQPNMALSIQELMERFRRGQSIPTFETDTEVEKLKRMDKIEQMEYVKDNMENALQKLQNEQDERERSQASSKESIDPESGATETSKKKPKGVPKTPQSSQNPNPE